MIANGCVFLFAAPTALLAQTVGIDGGGAGGGSQDLIKIIGYGAATVTFVLGLAQYIKAERWKRAEFIAKETKDFFDRPEVGCALLMIDWAQRRVPLGTGSKSDDPANWPIVTRRLQCLAPRHQFGDARTPRRPQQ
jgi:hypothetical protein